MTFPWSHNHFLRLFHYFFLFIIIEIISLHSPLALYFSFSFFLLYLCRSSPDVLYLRTCPNPLVLCLHFQRGFFYCYFISRSRFLPYRLPGFLVQGSPFITFSFCCYFYSPSNPKPSPSVHSSMQGLPTV